VDWGLHKLSSEQEESQRAPRGPDSGLSVFSVPAFQDNYIWLIRRTGTPYAAIVDPGDARPVLHVLKRLALTPTAILVTHHHGDHVGGISALRQHLSIPVYGPAGENIPHLDHPLQEGQELTLQGLDVGLRVLLVPGHTLGHIAYLGDGCLFCGDTLFTGGCGRLFEGTPQQMHASLTRLAALPEETRVYCAHEYTLANLRFAKLVEPDNRDLLARMAAVEDMRAKDQATVPSDLGLEKRTNPFLRCDVPPVVGAAERFAGRRLRPGEEVFAVIRHWKDTQDQNFP
jgi:hydroxyacylglutathione hydrolase